jgi:DNA (cytosine-5)-methyltransferase 1
VNNGHDKKSLERLRYIDLFCGLGGFRVAIERAAPRHGFRPVCAFSSDIDEPCQAAYEANFGDRPRGDITAVAENSVPDHDLLLAGFPCQPFSILGHRKGFEDTRGTLFFDIARILQAKRPKAFVLENVKLLVGHNRGRTLARVMETLRQLGYQADYRVFNALHFGLPQKRERVFIVGFRKPAVFDWPAGGVAMTPLSDILEQRVPPSFYASDYIRDRRRKVLQSSKEPAIWHENKNGHISAYPYSCALRADASYNYLLVNGERRLTPREMLRLQGFPDSYKIVCPDGQTRKQAGNSVPVPVVEAVLEKVCATVAKKCENW